MRTGRYTTPKSLLGLGSVFLALFVTGALAQDVIYESSEIVPEDVAADSHFGSGVALYGPTAVIGFYGRPSSFAVFEKDEAGAWNQITELPLPEQVVSSSFGWDVAVHTDTIIVGDPGDDGGVVHVYERNRQAGWEHVAQLRPTEAFASSFGEDVALFGDSALITDQWGSGLRGAAWFFERNASGVWVEEQKFELEGAPEYTLCGSDVGISQDIAVIGCAEDYDGGGGSVYILQKDDSGWTIVQNVQASDRKQHTYFGEYLAFDGNTLAVWATDSATSDVPKVYIFEESEGRWTETASFAAEGMSAPTLHRERLILREGEFENRELSVYGRKAFGSWPRMASLQPAGTSPAERSAMGFGSGVAVYDDLAIIGASNKTTMGLEGAGTAYVFDLSPLRPEQPIAIDVRPGNGRNIINPSSRGRLWVAILSDEAFDPLQVDHATVAFGPGEALPDRYRVKDANRDRLPDLMLRFRTPEVGIQCGDTELQLKGETYAGDRIIGTDAVKTVGCKKPKKGKKK